MGTHDSNLTCLFSSSSEKIKQRTFSLKVLFFPLPIRFGWGFQVIKRQRDDGWISVVGHGWAPTAHSMGFKFKGQTSKRSRSRSAKIAVKRNLKRKRQT